MIVMTRETDDYKTSNERIAAILGFRKIVGHRTNGVEDDLVQWAYPKGYEDLRRSTPVTEIPDFVGIINRYFDAERKYPYGMYEGSQP